MTLARLLKVYPDMFGQVYPGLLKSLDPARPEGEWRALFRPGWKSPEEHVGYALAEGERLVAFLGLLFAEIPAGSGTEKLCNVTSWVAHEDYRRESISLLLPLRRETGYTLTNMSGEAHVREVFRRLGFRMLEDRTAIFPPGFSPRRWRRARGLRIHRGEGAIRAILDGPEGQIYRDHAPYGRHLVVEAEEGCCYCLYHVRRRRGLRTALFHYVSHVPLFIRALPALGLHLLRRHGTVLTECDARLLKGAEVPGSLSIQRKFPRLYRSSTLEREEVPNLYSEVVLLNLE
jgi:hypothetical protein